MPTKIEIMSDPGSRSPTIRRGRNRNSVSKSRSRSRSPRRVGRVRTKRIVIANCPYDVNWQKLKELFREKVGYTGYLEMIEVNGKPIGMGVMEFRTYEGAEKAIETMHRYELGDRKLVVREETDRDRERIAQYKSGVDPQQAQHTMNMLLPQLMDQLGVDGPATNSIYISNLDYTVTWQKLKDVFRLAGHVVNVDIKTGKDGNSRGFAVVKFEHPFEAVQAISMFNGQMLLERPMRIKMDREGHAGGGGGGPGGPRGGAPGGMIQGGGMGGPRGGGPMGGRGGPMGGRPGGRLPEGLKGVGMGLGVSGQPLRGMQDLAMMTQNSHMGGGGMGGGGGGGVEPIGYASMGGGGAMMGNGSSGTQNAALMGLQQLLTAAAAGGMNQDQLLNAAASLGQGMLGGGGDMRNGAGDGRMGGRMSGGRGMDDSRGSMDDFRGSGRGSFGRAIDMPQQPIMMGGGGGMGIGGRQASGTVSVKNLPFSYTWQDLKRSFREVGDVRQAEIRTDANNRSRGYGYVHFFKAEDAMRAVDLMNGARFDGRSIRVELDQQ